MFAAVRASAIILRRRSIGKNLACGLWGLSSVQKTVTAMEVAYVRQLHAQTPWSIIAVERSLSLHELRPFAMCLLCLTTETQKTQRINPQQSPVLTDRGRHANQTRLFAAPALRAVQD